LKWRKTERPTYPPYIRFAPRKITPEMPSYEDIALDQALECWRAGQALEAGRLIFESLPNDIPPKWAAGVLRLVLERSGVRLSLFEDVLFIADHPPQWRHAHRTFSNVRDSLLTLDKKRNRGLTSEEQLISSLLSLSELVAKVTYNATDPLDRFDDDSGWWIAASLKGFVDRWRDPYFSESAWTVLSSRPH